MIYEAIIKPKYIKSLESIIGTDQLRRVLTCVRVELEAAQTNLIATGSFKLTKLEATQTNLIETDSFKLTKIVIKGVNNDVVDQGKNDIFKLLFDTDEKTCDVLLYEFVYQQSILMMYLKFTKRYLVLKMLNQF